MRRSKRARSPEALERFRLGRALSAEGQRERAVEAYLAALEIDPGFSEALVNLGILYGQMGAGFEEDALRCLTRASELSPDSARSHYNLGVALCKRKTRLDEAIRAFETAIAVDPNHQNALYALAVQWNRRGDPVKAAAYHQWYQEAMSGQKPAPAPRSRARSATAPAAPAKAAASASPPRKRTEPEPKPVARATVRVKPRQPLLRLRFVR